MKYVTENFQTFFSHVGHRCAQVGSLHLPFRSSLSFRPWYRFPSDHRDLRPLARQRIRPVHDYVVEKHLSDRVRFARSGDRHLRQYRRHRQLLQVKLV